MPDKASWPLGFRIGKRPDEDALAFVESFRDVPAAHVSDCMGRMVGTTRLRAYHGFGHMCGVALTVRVRPGDNLMIHKALDMARPHDVIVIDGGGSTSQALLGELMRATALSKGVAGFVVDGAIRDAAAFADGKLACFARGHTHRGPSKEGPGEINAPISCDGLAVMPGDLVIGDCDGVIAVRPHDAAGLAEAVKAYAAREAAIMLANESGRTDSDRIDSILRSKGVPL
mgnify:CR=1 FL=1